MIRYGKPTLGVFFTALLATSVVSSALADMIYDDEAASSHSPQQMSAAPTQVNVTQKVITNNEPVTTAAVVAEPAELQKASSRSREKRNFHENMNNELVVQKLEDRRLKQEEKLTAVINKRFTVEEDEPGTAAPVMREERVARPITETPGENSTPPSYQMSAAPRQQAVSTAPIAQDQISIYQSSTQMSPAPVSGRGGEYSGRSETSVKPEGEKLEKNGGVSISPRAGLSTLSNSFYNLNPKFMVGVGLGFDVADHVGLEFGYSYNEYGMRMNYGPNELQFKNNTFDAAMKLYLTGLDSKVRPFIGGGMAYSTGYVNYDDMTRQYLLSSPYASDRAMANDYQLSQFQGVLLGGLELKIAPNMSIGATYKYLRPLSSNESEQGFAWFIDPNKQAIRGSLRDSNVSVYQLSASIKF